MEDRINEMFLEEKKRHMKRKAASMYWSMWWRLKKMKVKLLWYKFKLKIGLL